VKSGSGSYYVRGKQYQMKEGDLIIFNHIEPHGWMVESEFMDMKVMIFSTNLVSRFKYDYLIPFIERGSDFKNKISKNDFFASEIVQMMDEIYVEATKKSEGAHLLILADVLRILTFLIRYYENDGLLMAKSETILEKRSNMKRLENALSYINEHYMEKITLKQVADLVFMSESYFSSYFKSVIDRSFIDYVTDLRLQRVNELIDTTDGSICEIAMESGFNNMANFYRIYKKHFGELSPRRRKINSH
jgi:YesN/AraC family two-component response regulator